MGSKSLLALAVIGAAAACTSARPPHPVPAPRPETPPSFSDYRATLEEAHERIATGLDDAFADPRALASIEVPEHPSIDGALHYFSTRLRPNIQASLQRSAPYKEMIDAVLDERRLPRALAWLPVIESAFVPTLTSKAGARGLWQFMPPTAREYGLRVDWWVDERADPELSTRAAAEYLEDLHRMFGDWSLALAAYNCGPGRVRRTLDREGVSTFWELLERSSLPKETRGYVPTFWATLRIAGDPAAHAFAIPSPGAEETETIEVVGPARLDFIAIEAGVEPATLRTLNPQLTQGLVPPGSTRLRVPPDAKPSLLVAAARAPFDDAGLPVTLFEVRSGQSIAELARITGAAKAEILAMNALRGERVAAGTSIYLPLSTTALSAALEASRHAAVYVVARGDTLSAIARRHGLSLAELLELNEIERDAIIRPGDRIRVSTARGVLAR